MAHVLIVTDDEDVRTVLELYLSNEGHHVLTTSEGDLALAILRLCQQPLVVLLHSWLSLRRGEDLLWSLAEESEQALERHLYVLAAPPSAIWQESHLSKFSQTHLEIRTLAQPFDLNDLDDVVTAFESMKRV
jgi:DNA-binding NtrC family response regulator